jgi:hypothetical protein
MAIMIPDVCPSKADAGEKRLFNLFLKLLPDNFGVWYEPVVKGRYPDFVLLADSFGLLVIEVKGWYAKQIQQVTDTEVQRLVTEGDQTHVVTEINPVRQVREYMYSLVDLLKQQPLLRNNKGSIKASWSFRAVTASCSRTSNGPRPSRAAGPASFHQVRFCFAMNWTRWKRPTATARQSADSDRCFCSRSLSIR